MVYSNFIYLATNKFSFDYDMNLIRHGKRSDLDGPGLQKIIQIAQDLNRNKLG
jgi:hypothetical protein